MHARRMWPVRSWRGTGLVPIYLALATLVSVSLAGFAVAVWPQGSAASAYRPAEGGVVTASRSFEAGSRPPPDARAAGRRAVWM